MQQRLATSINLGPSVTQLVPLTKDEAAAQALQARREAIWMTQLSEPLQDLMVLYRRYVEMEAAALWTLAANNLGAELRGYVRKLENALDRNLAASSPAYFLRASISRSA